jgi:hypothetical protein
MSKPKQRPLTQILQAVGKEEEYDNLGVKRPREQILAEMMWRWATEGRVTFLGGRVLEASSRDWKDAAQWIYQHSDGPASKEVVVDFGIDQELEEMTVAELEAVIQAAVDSDTGVTPESEGGLSDVV